MSRRTVAAIALTAIVAVSGSLLTGSIALAGGKDSKSKKKPVATIKIVKNPLGRILVDSKGYTLYVFDPDGTDTVSSKCIDACADVWPALTSKKKKPTVGKGLKQSLVGIGGGAQVVYNDHLLYRFSGDTAPSQTKGQGVGNVWHVVNSKGEPIV